MQRKLLFLFVLISLTGFYGMAAPQDYSRIARLSYIEGKVSFQHTNDVDWNAASINMALQPGDRIYTGDDGRAEVEFDDGSVLRLAEKSDVEVLTMNDQLIQLRVLIGLCSLTSRSSLQFEINTPAAAFTTTDKGSYRFDIAENGDSDGIVRKGQMDAANSRFSRTIESGEVLHVPAAENASEVVARYDQRDAWDEWTDRRNADETAYESRNYLPNQVYIGVGDLDRYGRWVNVDGYGYGWSPRVDPYWSPYWDGRWCYRPNWGWTWVSYEPWGWLPYHYGRWYHSVSFGWTWLPGPSFGFHFWSPGLVRFYHGADFVSWCPLGPGDYYNVNNYYYNRTYGYYLNNLRMLQRRGPDDLFNRGIPGAVRGVHSDQFVNDRIGGRGDAFRGGQDLWRGGRVVSDSLDIRPTARSYAPAPDRAAVRSPINNSRAVVIRTNPQVRGQNDRFVPVPGIGKPADRGETGRAVVGGDAKGQPARDSRQVMPNATGGRTNPIQGGTAPARVYQMPQSRQAGGNSGVAGRDVQRTTDRQDATPRAQQPANSRSDPARQSPPTSPRIRGNEPAAPVPQRQQVDRQAPARQPDVARPQAQPRPQVERPSTPPARSNTPPDKKVPDKKLESSYVPRQYPSGRAQPASESYAARQSSSQRVTTWQAPAAPSYSGRSAPEQSNARQTPTYTRQVAPQQPAARQAPAYTRQVVPQQPAARPSPAWNGGSTVQSYGNTGSSGYSAPQRSYNPGAGAAMRTAPQGSSIMRSAPQGYGAARSAPQSGSSGSRGASPRRRNQ